MPRANRYIQPGYVYHLTARCHDKTWLLKFAIHRNEYRKRLQKNVRGAPDVSLLSYCITSNHVHLLMTARHPEAISTFMQRLQGEFAERFNIQTADGAWMVREAEAPYDADAGADPTIRVRPRRPARRTRRRGDGSSA